MTPPGLLFSHPSSREHDPREHLADHPDTPERIEAIELALAAEGWLGWERRDAPAATDAQLEAVHDPAMIDRIAELCALGGGALDADTFVSEGSRRAAYHASGGACAMTRALVAAEATVALATVRPSGHHAERSRSMGFCLFNNVAIAAQLAIAELGTGALSDLGSGAGLGYTLNLPVSAGAHGDLWLSLLEHVILPAAAEFQPGLVLLSAGFDAHNADPVGGCRLETPDFAQMACHVRDLAREAGAPIGAVLEGGYDLDALPACVVATMRALAGEGETISSAPEALYTSRAAAQIGHYWEL